MYSGKWHYGDKSVDAEVARCRSCGTLRTKSVSSAVYDYSRGTVYASGELSYRHMRTIDTIRNHLVPGSILDIGCNAGEILDHLQKTDQRLTKFVGVDQNTTALSLNQNASLNLSFGNIDSIQETFDNVICVHTLEHIADLPTFFQTLRQRCRARTMVYFCVPNIRSFNALRNLKYWGAFNPIQHVWHFSASTLRRALTRLSPDFRLVALKTSWVWPPRRPVRLPLGLFDCVPFGDQLEAVLSLKNE